MHVFCFSATRILLKIRTANSDIELLEEIRFFTHPMSRRLNAPARSGHGLRANRSPTAQRWKRTVSSGFSTPERPPTKKQAPCKNKMQPDHPKRAGCLPKRKHVAVNLSEQRAP